MSLKHRWLFCVRGFRSFGLQVLALVFKNQGERLRSKPIPSPGKPEISILMLGLVGVPSGPACSCLRPLTRIWKVQISLAVVPMPTLGVLSPSSSAYGMLFDLPP